jgi:hypothetical protein
MSSRAYCASTSCFDGMATAMVFVEWKPCPMWWNDEAWLQGLPSARNSPVTD